MEMNPKYFRDWEIKKIRSARKLAHPISSPDGSAGRAPVENKEQKNSNRKCIIDIFI